MATDPQAPASLKPGAIGFVDALVIGLAATSPAYSLAAVIGPIVVLVGVYAPGVLIASFVPMLLIASAFLFLNKVDQDCGTTFSWVTRAMGPWFGWVGGWAITMTGRAGHRVAGRRRREVHAADVRPRRGGGQRVGAMPLALVLILVMTAVCARHGTSPHGCRTS